MLGAGARELPPALSLGTHALGNGGCSRTHTEDGTENPQTDAHQSPYCAQPRARVTRHGGVDSSQLKHAWRATAPCPPTCCPDPLPPLPCSAGAASRSGSLLPSWGRHNQLPAGGCTEQKGILSQS